MVSKMPSYLVNAKPRGFSQLLQKRVPRKKRGSGPDQRNQDSELRPFCCRKLRYSERRKSSICCCCVLLKPLNAPTEPQASLGGTMEAVAMQ